VGTPDGDYTAELTVAAPCARVFSALTTPEGLATWWTPIVSGTLAPGTRFELGFPDSGATVELRVERARPYALVEWTCLSHTAQSEWKGTTLEFRLLERGPDATALSFRHAGLDPTLGCYRVSKVDWRRTLRGLRESVETGGAPPFADLNAAA